MGLKHKKYAYVKLGEGKYVKVRLLKNKAENLPERYIVVGPVVNKPPIRALVLDINELPGEVAEKILNQYYEVIIK